MKIPSLALVAILALGNLSNADAGTPKDSDWPCIQIKVPSLSLGMMWAGPELEPDAASWRSEKKIVQLSNRLAVRRTDLDQAAQLIESFAGTIKVEERNLKLTQLIVATLEKIDAERRKVMAGIERFTKKQRILANGVRDTRAQFTKALAIENPAAKDDQNRRDLEQKLLWQTRIHDDRERSLKFVCESPVLLEQRAFAIAREIANHLVD